jgi:anti-anti-sigma regulatory factor
MGFADSRHSLVTREDRLAFAGRATGGTVVWLQDDRDAFTVDGQWEIVGRVIEPDAADVVIDLSRAEFTGAATVRVIKRTRDSLRARSQSLTLRFPSTWARRVLGLDSVADGLLARRADVTPASLSTSSDRVGIADRAGR